MKLEDLYLCRGGALFQAHITRDHKSYRFNKVREMISNLIAQPKEEALEDAEHKDLCDTELTTNTQARKEKTATMENLHATVNELKTSMEKFGTGSDETLRPGVSSSRRTRRHAGRTPTDEMVSQMHGCWSETRFVVRQSRDTDWETAFFSGY